MKNKIYNVYDAKVKAYLSPFFMRNSGEATRAFGDVCNDPKSQFCKYPEDYTLFEIGEYDDETGTIIQHEAKIPLGNALAFKNTNSLPENVTQLTN